jgi:VWFA-related protein
VTQRLTRFQPPIPNAARSIVTVIDDLNVRPSDSILVRSALRQLRNRVLRDDDLLAIASTGFSSIAVDMRRDPTHERLDAAIERAMGSAPPPYVPAGPAGASAIAALNDRAQIALRTARDLVWASSATRDRARALILLSGGYHVNPLLDGRLDRARDALAAAAPPPDPFLRPATNLSDADVVAAMARLAAEARRLNVVIYAINPAGLESGPDIADRVSRDEWQRATAAANGSLRALSEATGGFCACETNDLAPSLRRLDWESSEYYLVEFGSDDLTAQRPRRRIRVETTRPGVTLRYVPEFFVPR